MCSKSLKRVDKVNQILELTMQLTNQFIAVTSNIHNLNVFVIFNFFLSLVIKTSMLRALKKSSLPQSFFKIKLLSEISFLFCVKKKSNSDSL